MLFALVNLKLQRHRGTLARVVAPLGDGEGLREVVRATVARKTRVHGDQRLAPLFLSQVGCRAVRGVFAVPLDRVQAILVCYGRAK